MRILNPYTIPSTFCKLDDRVTTADTFLDTASLQKARENHNVLMAQRIRRQALGHICMSYAGQGEFIRMVTPYTHANRPPVWLSGTLLVTQRTQKIRFCFYAFKLLDLASSPEFAIKFWQPGRVNPTARVNSDAELAKIAITAFGAVAWYTVDVELPTWVYDTPSLMAGYAQVGFTVYFSSPLNTEDSASGLAITDSGPNWLRGNLDFLLPTSYCLYTSNTVRQPSMIIGQIVYAVNDAKLYVDPPFSSAIPTSETANIRQVNGVQLYSFSIIELPITDFAASIGRFL